MKKIVTVTALTLGLSMNSLAQADGVDEQALSRLQAQLPQTLEGLYQQHQFKGDFLLAVIDKNGLRYSYTLNGLGNESKENGLSTKTPFLIASHTKALTGTLAQVLEDEGKLDLDAPIATYLADEIKSDEINTQSITVTQLLNHTAGFTSIMHTFKTAFLGYETEEDLVDALNTGTLVAPPGVFRYSNTGPILAARAMEEATGESWKTLMQKKLFSPLGMHDTSSNLSDYPEGTILPSIEVGKDGEVLRTGLFKTDQTLHAAGGTVSTLADMAKWLTFNLNQSQHLSGSADFFTALHQPTTAQEKRYFTYERSGYSLAWDIADYNGLPILTRFGGYAGNSFHASFMPEQNVAVVAFFNDQRGYVLPHLAANYAYNLVVAPELAQSRFTDEVEGFQKSVAREQANALDRDDRVVFSQQWQNRLGTFTNNDGWPDIVVYQSGNEVWLQSGVLSGPIYKAAEQSEDFVVNLGSIRRPIKFEVSPEGELTLLNGSLRYLAADPKAPEIMPIYHTNVSALLDGRCGNDEWENATKMEHPASATVYLMHDSHYLYICAKGSEGELTVLDVYVQNNESKKLHKFHLSAQMGESVFSDNEWRNELGTWQLKDWTGFWVPYFGTRDTENGKLPKFYSDSHRQVQIARKKFPGNTWKMMFTVSVRRNSNWVNILVPEKAIEHEVATWGTFNFSENGM